MLVELFLFVLLKEEHWAVSILPQLVMSFSYTLTTIKIDGKTHEISKLKHDRSNWRVHRDDWESVFLSCPNLKKALTGEGDYHVKVKTSAVDLSTDEEKKKRDDHAELWETEARRIHKQKIDQE